MSIGLIEAVTGDEPDRQQLMTEVGLSPPFIVHPHGDGWAVASADVVLVIAATQREALEIAAEAAAILRRSWLEPPRRAAEPRSFGPRGD